MKRPVNGERYLKGAVAFRGVPMGKIRTVIHEVWAEQQLQTLAPDDSTDTRP